MQRKSEYIKEQKQIYQRLIKQNGQLSDLLMKNISLPSRKAQKSYKYSKEVLNKSRIYQINNKLKHNFKDVLYQDALKQGIKILFHSNISKTQIYKSQHKNKTRQRNKTDNPQEKSSLSKNKNIISLNNIVPKMPEKQAIQLSTFQMNSAIKSPQSSYIIKTHHKKPSYKNSIFSIKTDKKLNISKLGRHKQQIMKLSTFNRHQTTLQEQLLKDHLKTKDFVDQMRLKYNLNFKNQRKYLKNHKKQPRYSLPQIQHDIIDVIRELEIKSDDLTWQSKQLSKLLKLKKNDLQHLQLAIQDNQFNVALKRLERHEYDTESIHSEQQNIQTEQGQANSDFIKKLRIQLDGIREYNKNCSEKDKGSDKSKVFVNQRLKDIIF